MSPRIVSTAASHSDKVIPFPSYRRRNLSGCPSCGTHTDLWRFGRILWAYCDTHELRWVAADFVDAAPLALDRRRFGKTLEFLSSFAEVTR